jgi:FkbM family methyltransferase
MLTTLGWRISRKKSGLARWLRDQASTYIEFYDDFGYDFATNGEAYLVETLSRFTPRIVFDVGANVGDWSRIAAAAFPDARVFAFELSSSTRAALKAHLNESRFIVPEVALSSSDGEIEYKDYGELSTVNTIVDTAYHDSTKSYTMRRSSVVRGDSYMQSEGLSSIDLLKVDVEGAEFHVLQGFRKTLQEGAIKVIQFEYGHANGDTGHLMRHFYSFLEPMGYVIGRLWTAGVQFSPFEYRFNNFDSGPNYVAVLQTEAAIIKALRSKE